MCPVCGEWMVTFEFGGVEVDRCLECGGTWLDAGELEQMIAQAGAPTGKVQETLHRAQGGKHGKRLCVRCQKKLLLVELGPVHVDRCPRGHGLWFDKGELRTLVLSFEEGSEGALARHMAGLFASEVGTEAEKGG